MSKDLRTRRKKYHEVKKPKQFVLTGTASELLDEIAKRRDLTRSETVEQLIREQAKKIYNRQV